jgi:hypothetical protein
VFHELSWTDEEERPAVPSVATMIGWGLSQFQAVHRDWELLRQVVAATNGGKIHWLGYYDERTREFAYGGVEAHQMDSYLRLLTPRQPSGTVKAFVSTFGKPIGGTSDEFLCVSGTRHPEDRALADEDDKSSEEITAWYQRRMAMHRGEY